MDGPFGSRRQPLPDPMHYQQVKVGFLATILAIVAAIAAICMSPATTIPLIDENPINEHVPYSLYKCSIQVSMDC
jgi:hypothetical protein